MARAQDPWKKTIQRQFKQVVRWLTPGLGIKRWLLVFLVGTTMIAVGLAFLFLDIYRSAPGTWWLPYLSALSLRFLDRTWRIIIFSGIGVGLILFGIWGMNRALLSPFTRPGLQVLDTVSEYRRKGRGPRIVAIGGGTGLSSLLRGLKAYTHNITAIVTVADDGGSSGELRRNMGILPPGDIRNCLTALSNDEDLLTQVFQYRFGSGAGLNGHSLGNLFISALTEITGSFEDAVAESGRVLAVQGRVLPSTLHDVRLVADIRLPSGEREIRVIGESLIPKAAGKVSRIWLEPNSPPAFPPAIQAILSADLIIVGPGSLYTSLLPNLLVPDLAEAIRCSRALKFFVCNVTTQPGETDGFNCGDHIRAVEELLGKQIFDLVIANRPCADQPPEGSQFVAVEADLDQSYPVYCTDLLDKDQIRRHDSEKLAQAVIDLFYERTGPLAGA